MDNDNPEKVFEKYLKDRNLRISTRRMLVLRQFLRIEKHVTAEELHGFVKKTDVSVGTATIYRTLKLLCEAGICREVTFDDRSTRYEHLLGHEHHDHMICTECGTFIEVNCPEIEKLQEQIASKEGFLLKNHRLHLYGICAKCRKMRGTLSRRKGQPI